VVLLEELAPQAQYTEPLDVVAAGPRLAVAWQAQYTEPPGAGPWLAVTGLPGGAVARVVAAGPRLAVV